MPTSTAAVSGCTRPGFRAVLVLVAALVPALALTGCDSKPDLEQVRAEIELAVPGIELSPDVNIHLGRFSLGLVRWVAGRDDRNDGDDRTECTDRNEAPSGDGATGADSSGAGEDRLGESLLHAIRHIDLATYQVRTLPAPPPSDALSGDLGRRLAAAGWHLVVHQADAREQAWIFYRGGEDGERFTELYVVSLESRELSLIRLSGHFDRPMAALVARHPRRVIPHGTASSTSRDHEAPS